MFAGLSVNIGNLVYWPHANQLRSWPAVFIRHSKPAEGFLHDQRYLFIIGSPRVSNLLTKRHSCQPLTDIVGSSIYQKTLPVAIDLIATVAGAEAGILLKVDAYHASSATCTSVSTARTLESALELTSGSVASSSAANKWPMS